MTGIYFIDTEGEARFTVRKDLYKADINTLFAEGVEDGHVTVIGVYGPLDEGYWDTFFSTYLGLSAELEKAMADDRCRAVILAVNSPGGACAGLFSFTDYIRECTARKPVYAYIHGEACSAAYAIAAACSRVYAASDARTGCCGAYGVAVERDEEYLRKEAGIIRRIFRSAVSPRKNVSPISDEQAAEETQKEIDALGERYITAVAGYRGIDPGKAAKDFGEGRVVTAEYAVSAGMIDGIRTPEEIIGEISSLIAGSEASEGEDMQEFSSMTAEERAAAFSELVALSPDLLSAEAEKARGEERRRIQGLNALRVNGNAEINALIDKAIEEGTDAASTAMKCYGILRSAKDTKASAEGVLEALADDTSAVRTPQAMSEDDLIKAAAEKVGGER